MSDQLSVRLRVERPAWFELDSDRSGRQAESIRLLDTVAAAVGCTPDQCLQEPAIGYDGLLRNGLASLDFDRLDGLEVPYVALDLGDWDDCPTAMTVVAHERSRHEEFHGDIEEGARWHRQALDAFAARFGPTVQRLLAAALPEYDLGAETEPVVAGAPAPSDFGAGPPPGGPIPTR